MVYLQQKAFEPVAVSLLQDWQAEVFAIDRHLLTHNQGRCTDVRANQRRIHAATATAFGA